MPKPTGRNAPKVEIRTGPASVAEEKRLLGSPAYETRRWNNRRQRQKCCASSARHPANWSQFFRAMLERAVRLRGAKFGKIDRWDGEALHILASHNTRTVAQSYFLIASHASAVLSFAAPACNSASILAIREA